MQASDAAPAINPLLDARQLRQYFGSDGRVHIRDFLEPAGAARLHRCLVDEVDYRLTIPGAGGSQRVKQSAMLTPPQRAQMAHDAYASARDKFQFLYDSLPMSNEGEAYPDLAHYLARITAFLNGPEFLGFARSVTGLQDIAFAEAQATRYGRGHFLTAHDDDDQGKAKRLAAYVLNMTPGWRADWGGVLMFPDAHGNVAAGYTPAYNALNIFQVPRLHMVSMVMPFAVGGRYSVTGWLRAR